MQDKRGTRTPATVAEKRPEPRSYTIHTPNDGLYHRNWRQLQDLPNKHIIWADEKADVIPHHPLCQRQQMNQPATSPMDNAPIQDGDHANTTLSPTWHSSRQIKPPIRLTETMYATLKTCQELKHAWRRGRWRVYKMCIHTQAHTHVHNCEYRNL